MGKWREAAQKTYDAIQKSKKDKEYKKRVLNCELIDIHVKGMEKSMRRKMGQF